MPPHPLRYFVPILAVCALLAACDNTPQGQNPKMMGGPPQAPKVTIATPIKQTIDKFKDFTGRFEASSTIDIRARVSGYITAANFKEGAIVKKGAPLFLIDPRPYEAAYKKADADVKVATSRIALTDSNYNRADALFQSGDISAQIRDQRLQERDQAQAELARAKAARDQAKLDLSYTRITAPITGKIGQIQADVGNYIAGGSNGATVLATIVALDPIYFTFNIDESAFLEIARKNNKTVTYPVTVSLADEKEFSHEGVTDFLNNQLDRTTGTMQARATFPNKDMFLTPGMFGRARIMLGTQTEAVLIPESAILTDQSRKFVYMVDDKNIVSSQTIETGLLTDDGQREITKGINGNETIIINGLQRVREGVTVTTEAVTQP